jgi:hypothetical protein
MILINDLTHNPNKLAKKKRCARYSRDVRFHTKKHPW